MVQRYAVFAHDGLDDLMIKIAGRPLPRLIQAHPELERPRRSEPTSVLENSWDVGAAVATETLGLLKS
jgi:hypothetical protein